jgi:hypothetical protein
MAAEDRGRGIREASASNTPRFCDSKYLVYQKGRRLSISLYRRRFVFQVIAHKTIVLETNERTLGNFTLLCSWLAVRRQTGDNRELGYLVVFRCGYVMYIRMFHGVFDFRDGALDNLDCDDEWACSRDKRAME